MSITIKHLEGPLAGEEQHFDDSVSAILFGRDRETAQVVYPPELAVVGRKHFELRRTRAGDYTVELFGKRYVEIDGTPADNGTPVKSGSAFRLGRKDGPAFAVEIGAPSVDGLAVTDDQSEMLTAAERHKKLRRQLTIGSGALAAMLAIIVASIVHMHSTYGSQLALARAEAAERAEKEFSKATLATLEGAVYLVARKEGNTEKAEGTAWAFAPDKLATNAHVTEAIKGKESEFFLIGPDGKHIRIEKVFSHPGYLAFKSYKVTQGTTRWGKFTPLNLINQYDVGIIEIDPAIVLPVVLALASEEHLTKLAPGTPVASVGFPVENLAGSDTATKAPGTLHFGHISSLTDVFMSRAEPDQRLLVQHSVPVTGGASGSPLIDPSGKVIGIVNGGNTTVFKDQNEAMNAKVRMPNAALINFAQRADLLEHLAAGEADRTLAEDQTYWRKTAEQFDDYFDGAVKAFIDLAKSRYAVADATYVPMGNGTLDAGKDADSFKLVSESYTYKVEPGKLYGFIADAESGVPVGINVKKKGSSDFLRDAKDPRQTSELELAPTAWVTAAEPTEIEVIVWSLVTQPAKYALHVYSWEEPKPTPSADAAPATSRQ